jgi:hypothetical protein
MNVHAPTEDKIDDIKDRFYENLVRRFQCQSKEGRHFQTNDLE